VLAFALNGKAIEVGKRRVRIRGLSMDRAEQCLRECLK